MDGLKIGTDVCETAEPVDNYGRPFGAEDPPHPRIPQGFHN